MEGDQAVRLAAALRRFQAARSLARVSSESFMPFGRPPRLLLAGEADATAAVAPFVVFAFPAAALRRFHAARSLALVASETFMPFGRPPRRDRPDAAAVAAEPMPVPWSSATSPRASPASRSASVSSSAL